MAEFKDILKGLRHERGFSQIALSDKMNISKSTIAMWETGKRLPSRDNMEEIADIFNVDTDYLYGKSEIKRKVSFDSDGNPLVYIPEYENDTMELIELFGKATAEQKQAVLNLLRSFCN